MQEKIPLHSLVVAIPKHTIRAVMLSRMDSKGTHCEKYENLTFSWVLC